jgi:hypothetical protein
MALISLVPAVASCVPAFAVPALSPAPVPPPAEVSGPSPAEVLVPSPAEVPVPGVW